MLTDVLAERYGLSNIILAPAPRGFVAETYYVDADTRRYFAKIVKTSPDSECIQRSLPVMLELRQLGIERITYPIPTTDGQYSVHLDGKILVLFNYIEGHGVDDYPLEPYVQLLAQVHQVSDRIQAPLLRETFDISFKSDLLAQLDWLWTGKFDHPQENALQEWAHIHREEIVRDFAILEQTVTQLSSREKGVVLTHGDAPGNVLYDGTHVYLVDWDTVMFAPRERDTWFDLYTEGFLPLYQEFVPGYEFDRTACRFYLYRRYFEDMVGFVEKVLSPDSSDEQKAHNLSELYKTCDGWLRPLMEANRAKL